MSSYFDISDDESGMVMGILFKPRVGATQRNRVEATEQPAEEITQNRTFRNPRINESKKSRLSDMYVVLVSCLHSILRLAGVET